MAIRLAMVGSVVVVLCTLSNPVAGQGDMRAPAQLEDESAGIAGDHALLADYFRAMAEAARARVRLYGLMAGSPDSGTPQAQPETRHYERLVEHYQAIAEEYDALATLYDDEAREAR